jgi:hypothetical protein
MQKPVALVLTLTLLLSACNSTFVFPTFTDTQESRYKVGQVWSYKTRPVEPNSELVIVKVEKLEIPGIVVHISVRGLKLKSPTAPGGYTDQISHMPFAERAIDASVLSEIGSERNLPDYLPGYKDWLEHNGGVFTRTVAEAIDVIEQPVIKP